MGVIVSSIGKFADFVRTGLHERRLATALLWEIENACEIISSWSVDQISADRIGQLPFSNFVTEELSDTKWVANIRSDKVLVPTRGALESSDETALHEVEQSEASLADEFWVVDGLRVHLRLSAKFRGQEIQPVERIFWVFPDESSGIQPGKQ